MNENTNVTEEMAVRHTIHVMTKVYFIRCFRKENECDTINLVKFNRVLYE